jgi:hypothetical protein
MSCPPIRLLKQYSIYTFVISPTRATYPVVLGCDAENLNIRVYLSICLHGVKTQNIIILTAMKTSALTS